jgi:hypothetical protein
VIDPAGRILFQRSRDTGLWELPAGATEPGDSFTTAELHPPTRLLLGLYDVFRASGVFQAH